MKKLIGIILAIPFLLHGQINFESSWKEALSKSRTTGKPIFFNAVTEWCEPCNEMGEYTFTNLEIINYFNTNFINISINMETYPGVDLAEQFEIRSFPTFLFINKKGTPFHRGCGAMDANELLLLGKEALIDSLSLKSIEERYDKEKGRVDFMLKYLALLENGCIDAEKFAKDHLKTISLDHLIQETPWEIFSAYQWDIYSREFQYLLKNQTVIKNKIGDEKVNTKIYNTYLFQYQEVFEAEELHDFGMRSLLNSIRTATFVGADTLKLMMNFHYAAFTENWDEYAQYAIELVEKTEEYEPEQLNEIAWNFYLFVDNRDQLKTALKWTKQGIEELSIPSIIDTYASLLFKLGEKKKAIQLEKKALELAENLYEDISHYEYQLNKFQN